MSNKNVKLLSAYETTPYAIKGRLSVIRGPMESFSSFARNFNKHMFCFISVVNYIDVIDITCCDCGQVYIGVHAPSERCLNGALTIGRISSV